MCSNNFDWILPDIALGNIVAGSNLPELHKQDITAIIAILPSLPYKVKYYSNNGFSLFHIPLYDTPKENITKWFDHVSDFLMAHRFMGRKVLIHCHAGVSRSATLVASYLMNLKNWNHHRALKYIRSKRGCINPNPGFVKQLVVYNSKKDKVKPLE